MNTTIQSIPDQLIMNKLNNVQVLISDGQEYFSIGALRFSMGDLHELVTTAIHRYGTKNNDIHEEHPFNYGQYSTWDRVIDHIKNNSDQNTCQTEIEDIFEGDGGDGRAFWKTLGNIADEKGVAYSNSYFWFMDVFSDKEFDIGSIAEYISAYDFTGHDPASKEELFHAMEKLDESMEKNQITEGEYIVKCKELQDKYWSF